MGSAPPPDTTRRHLEKAQEVVRINLACAFQRQQKYFNLRRRPWKPKIGECVYKREYPLSNKAAAFNAKLAKKFVGPLEVRRVISPVIVDLRSRNGRWYRHIHVQDLKPASNASPTETEADTDNDDSEGEADGESDTNNNNSNDTQQ
ncbi:hypothetical protein ALC60_01256 [Trachymyrmex zeteki]|uniref:Uncharacterized protein n=2 Tax=Mycetomoellerius zeteki TaxID=64791 RepID=A0A151XHB9_9HYME|nr:hypothetical protein ALC60_01256 [Trachymyrmex zeteki]